MRTNVFPFKSPLGLLLSLTLLLMMSSAVAAAPVRLYETDLVIPTYLSGPPDPNPMFFFGRESQGAEGRIYPYPLYDNLTQRKGDKSYHLVYLENEFVRIGILPEIGGRLFEAVDKGNNYDFVYRQHVIKPALIGLIGAWISGGIEWNIPHHHRATTFLPVQWRTEELADGGKTVWVGELEVRHRMRWAVGYTLHPGSSVLTCSVRIMNRTPEAHTMLCFANVAVNANDNYQIIFPPRTQWVTYHHKNEFASWPIAHSRYQGADFTAGVDVSWYKNHINANSMFAWNYAEDFFAGYDHGKQAGTMSVADHHIVPGKKFWTWGSGAFGRMWDEVLTDADGPYIELMVGAYSDNQPDYSWMQPFETRVFDMNWYPFRDIGGAKNANLDAAVNLEVTNGVAKLGFHTTAAHAAATVRLTAAEKILVEETIAINPVKSYRKQIQLPAGVSEQDLRAALSVGARELIGYAPVQLVPELRPPVATNPPAPADAKGIEEVFLAGQRVEQFHDAKREAEPYWQEALRRDPGDSAAHLGLGRIDLGRARFASAEQHFRKAIERLAANHTTPKDLEPFYYLGVALKAQGRSEEAYDAFFKAAWSQEWKGPAYFSLAEIATLHGDFSVALDLVDRSLNANALNVPAWGLKAAVLRHLGRGKEVRDLLATAARKTDPLDVRLMAEGWLATGDKTSAKRLFNTLADHAATAQELAAEYANAGLWRDGTNMLGKFIAAAPDGTKVSPLLYYYLGEFAERLGDPARAADFRRSATRQPADYVFPFQAELVAVLCRAIEADPGDARAPYYLGNLLFDWQPEEAIALWEKSAALDPAFAITWRNLAQAPAQKADDASRAQAIGYLEKAVAQAKVYPTHLSELDELYAGAGAALEKRLALLERNQAVALQKDESAARLINLWILAGKTDQAISLLQSRTFSVWEGKTAFSTGELWTDAHLARGLQHLEAKEFQAALADFEAALKYPVNLRAGESGGASAHQAEIGYWTGCALEALDQLEPARAAWTNATTGPVSGRGERRGRGALAGQAAKYYQAAAGRKLGQVEQANATFRELIAAGAAAIAPAEEAATDANERQTPRARLAAGNYLAGLGHAGLGEKEDARAAFTAVLAAKPDHLRAKLALQLLNNP
jgi:tetratricopeptide (TPR) repeat protein